MTFENSLSSVTTDISRAMTIIADNMIKTRPRGMVEYRPFRKDPVWRDAPTLGPRCVDLSVLYLDARVGNIAFVGTVLESVSDYDAKLNVRGGVKVFYGGKLLCDCTDRPRDEWVRADLPLKEGENPIVFMVQCAEDGFYFEFMPSVRVYRMWAKDYIAHVRATSPLTAFAHEDGIGVSRLYDDEDDAKAFGKEKKKYIYPTVSDTDETDFEKIFPDASGVCAYAFTVALKNAKLSVDAYCKTKVTVNGEEVLPQQFKVKRGDFILVKSLKGVKWGFKFDKDAPIGIPFMDSARGVGDKWLTLGTFGTEYCLDTPYGPELSLQFENPYITADWKKTFWKLGTESDFVRPYMDTCFYSQWFYALMVGHFGLLKAGRALDRGDYTDYFAESMQTLARFRDYMHYELETFGQTTFIQKGMALGDLDSIGTMGMNMCELYKLTSSPESLECIEILAKAAKENIPRFEDGTYHRPKDMWSDDTFMSCPFLARLGLIKNDRYYFDEAVRQLLGFKKRLWMADKKIFSHIYFLDTQSPNNIPWGRGNGWVFVTLSDVLENMPKHIDGRDELLALYREFAEGIAALQDGDGLWHQVLTRADSYAETSCTGMFILGICRGLNHGWLGDEYRAVAQKAYDGLIRHKIDADGNVYDVCMGSGNSRDEEYYVNLGAIDNDDHGTGIILAALSELIQVL